MSLGTDKKIEIYRSMLTAQLFEQRLLRMIDEGLISGFYHAGRGQEASEVGAVAALREDDYLLYDHRGCAHMIAKGMDLVELFGDFLANDLGTTKGLGAGIVHIADPKRGVLGQSGTLGGGHVLAAGVGLSIKLRKTDQVVINFFGDGAANRGTFHEGANVAGAWKLPVIFVVQNNGWAISTPVSYSSGGDGFAARAAGYGMAGVTVDGMDPHAVFEATEEAVARARAGEGPTLIESITHRFRGHFEGDPQGYRLKDELRSNRELDPIPATRSRLIDDGVVSESEMDSIDAAVTNDVERAAEKAMTGTKPGRERLGVGLYAGE